MTYDTIASISQVTSLLMFIAMFIAVVAYALWPRNGPHFEHAQRKALDLEQIPPALPLPHEGGGDDVASASRNVQRQHAFGGRK